MTDDDAPPQRRGRGCLLAIVLLLFAAVGLLALNSGRLQALWQRARQEVGEIAALHDQIQSRFHVRDVGVHVQFNAGLKSLRIELEDDRLDPLTPEQLAAPLEAVARFAYYQYAMSRQFDTIDVVVLETSGAISRSHEVRFTPQELSP